MEETKAKLLSITLFLLFFGAPLAIFWGTSHGYVVFTGYRESKFIHVQVFSWAVISLYWVYLWNGDASHHERLKAILRDRYLWLLAFFFGYMALTATNALVVEASIYELIQFFTLLNLYIVLVFLWQDKQYLKVGLLGATCGLALATSLGLYQYWIGPIPFMIPLSRYYSYASTFGYKNPMALAISAQIFLIVVCFVFMRPCKWLVVNLAIGLLLLGLELFYVAILGSRTSYVAVTVSSGGLMVLVILRAIFQRRLMALSIAAILVVIGGATFSLALRSSPVTRARLNQTMVYLKNPKAYWKSDRGTYLRNSIYMANSNLLGVGIGNWGIAYPFYRKVRPRFLFNKRVQVRRAHSDYAQMLGETGWPGLLLFLAVLGWPFYRGMRLALASVEGNEALLFTVQLLAFFFLMLTDYCIEMPYHKFFLFCIIAAIQAQFMRWSKLATDGQI